MMFLLPLSLTFAMLAAPVTQTRTYCGVRSGTAGNAFLESPGEKDTLVLAEQGGSQRLLEQIDFLVGPDGRETGTQNGKHYCAVVKFGADDKPVKVVKAWRQHK